MMDSDLEVGLQWRTTDSSHQLQTTAGVAPSFQIRGGNAAELDQEAG
jgi:hypothetical protein